MGYKWIFTALGAQLQLDAPQFTITTLLIYFFIALIKYLFMKIICMQTFPRVLLHVPGILQLGATPDLSCSIVDLIFGSCVCHFLTMYMPFPHNDKRGLIDSQRLSGRSPLHILSFNVSCVVPSVLSNHADSFSYFHKLIRVTVAIFSQLQK